MSGDDLTRVIGNCRVQVKWIREEIGPDARTSNDREVASKWNTALDLEAAADLLEHTAARLAQSDAAVHCLFSNKVAGKIVVTLENPCWITEACARHEKGTKQ